MMISFEKALEIVLNTNIKTKTEKVTLSQSTGRILAEDVISDINMPPFNKSAMDGFAIRKNDIDKELTIIETVAAGQTPQKTIQQGEATKIMTGAPIPKGADFVVQVELSENINKNTIRFTGLPNKNNIIPKAEDVSVGDVVLTKGTKIDARHVAVMASAGYSQPLVYDELRVGIISTGSEIVEPEDKPNESQIRNSNGLQLLAQVKQCSALPIYFGIIKDDYEDTYTALRQAIEQCDVVLLTGGVSMGEFDFVPKIMNELGIKIHFDRVATQPGKPTTFGTIDDKFVFGLPGNPVSSFVQFEILVKPLIMQLMGSDLNRKNIKLPLAENYKRKKAQRLAFIPVTINEESEVVLNEYHGSAHINALPTADALAEIPMGVNEVKKGDLVNVRLL